MAHRSLIIALALFALVVSLSTCTTSASALSASVSASKTYTFHLREASVKATSSSTVAPAKAKEHSKSDDVELGPGAIAALSVIVGFCMAASGYQSFVPAAAICAYIFGAVTAAAVLEGAVRDDSAAWINWVAFGAAGPVMAAVVKQVSYSARSFLIGSAAGALLAYSLTTSVVAFVYIGDADQLLAVLVAALSVLNGVLTLKLDRPAIIAASSVVGAEMLVWGGGYFIGFYPSALRLELLRFETADGALAYDVPVVWWGYVGAVALAAAAGAAFQVRKSAADLDHRAKALELEPEDDDATVKEQAAAA